MESSFALEMIIVISITISMFLLFYLIIGRRSCACLGCSNYCDKKRQKKEKSKFLPLFLGILLVTVFFATSTFAGHPLITEDTGTQGQGRFQIETAISLWKNKETMDNSDAQKTKGGEFSPVITLGLHDRLDVSCTLSYQWWALRENGVLTARATGQGDMSIDLKWRLAEREDWSLALKPGIVIPSGDEQQGLGKGRIRYRTFVIVSKSLPLPLSFHFNLGYIRNNNNLQEKLNLWHASAAFEYEMAKRLKLMFDTGIAKNPKKDSRNHPAYALVGVGFAISNNLSLTSGFKRGLNDEETDLNFSMGLVFRF
ncbi:MAG: transporter [Syntrophales bacterium]|nr:transporter [Syntrophales bacterium]